VSTGSKVSQRGGPWEHSACETASTRIHVNYFEKGQSGAALERGTPQNRRGPNGRL